MANRIFYSESANPYFRLVLLTSQGRHDVPKSDAEVVFMKMGSSKWGQAFDYMIKNGVRPCARKAGKK